MNQAVVPHAHAIDAVLEMLAESLRGHVGDLAGELVSRILATEEGYSGGTGSVRREDLYASCHANLDRVLQMLACTVPPGADPLDAARATGRRRAAQLMPLGVVLHSYRLGGQLVWRGLVQESRRTSYPVSPDELVEVASRVWDVVDRGAMAVTEAYGRTEWQLMRREENHRATALQALLDGQSSADAAEVLSLPEQGTYLVAVTAQGTGAGTDAGAAVDPPFEWSLRLRGVTSSWLVHRGLQVGVVALGTDGGTRADEREARRVIDALLPGPAGVSPPVQGLTEVCTAYRLALLARRSLAPGSRTVAWLDDRLPEAMLADSPELAQRLAQRLLGPLTALPPPEGQTLLATVRAWAELEGSPTRVAEHLYCHRNTVLKRLHRVEHLTGTRLADVRDATAWQLALSSAHLLDT